MMSLFLTTLAELVLSPNTGVKYLYLVLAIATILILLGRAILTLESSPLSSQAVTDFSKFFYASFLKPHSGDGAHTGQKAALESFYKAQVRGSN